MVYDLVLDLINLSALWSMEFSVIIDLFSTNSFQSFQKTTTVTTGLSDFHNMAVTVLRATFPKASPRIISYRSPYQVEDLEKALVENLSKMETKTYESFEDMGRARVEEAIKGD